MAKDYSDSTDTQRHQYDGLLFNTMLQGVVFQDASGKIISMNPAAQRILGKNPSDFLGRTSIDEERHTLRADGTPFPGPEHPSMVALRTGREVRDVVMGVYNPREEGYRWISISAVPLFRSGEEKPYEVYILFEDITERKQAEEALQRERDFIDRVLSTVGALVVVLDREGRIIRFNRACEQLTGYAFEEVKGQPLWDLLLLPEECHAVMNGFAEMLEGQFTHTHQNHWITRSGAPRLIRWSNTVLTSPGGTIEYVIGTGIDITEIENANRRYAKILETALSGFGISDTKGKLLEVNEAYSRLIGYTRTELLSMSIADIEAVESPADVLRHIETLRENRTAHFITRHRRKDGSIIDVELNATYLDIGEGQVVVFIQDITERKEAESKLQESEAMLARAQQMAHVGHWDRDLSTAKVRWSDETYRIFGLEPQECEVHGPFLFQHIHPDDRASVERAIRDAAEGMRPYDEIYRPVRPDGTMRWVHARGEVTRTPDGKPIHIFGTILDITERKQMEEELLKARDELELRAANSAQLLSAAHDLAIALGATSNLQAALDLCLDTALHMTGMDFGGIYLVDAASGHLRLAAQRNVPDAFLPAVTDYDPETPNARLVAACRPVYGRWKDLNLPPDAPDAIRGIAILPICHEGKHVACLNLASFLVDDVPESARVALETVAAQIGGALVRIQAEEERRHLATVAEYAGEAVLVVDKSFCIQYVNPAFTRMTGYSQVELKGKDVSLLRSSEMDDSVYDAAREDLRTKGTWLGRLSEKRKDGSFFPVESLMSSIKDFTGNITGYVWLWRDISEQVRLEEQLRQSQKMEAVGTLAGGVAHDFNNILAITLGNAELAEEDIGNADAIKRNLEQIVTASKRGKELVRQILTFSRKTEQKRSYLRLIPLVQETCTLLRASIPTTIAMDLHIETGFDIIFADSADIQQILMNLINNAAHAMREKGGHLTISLSDVAFALGDLFLEPDMPPGNYLKVTVTDTGTGMTAEVRKRIFEPFFTTKELGQGTGMGLAMVYALVRSYQGAITVESKRGKGSIFNIFFPQSGGATISETRQTGAVPRGSESILFVDDEEPITLLTRVMLERLGYHVTATTEPTEAWRLFREQPFDLVITDQSMPGTTGLALAEKMLKIRKDIPVILCTGYSETVSAEQAKKAGVREFLMKPIAKKELAETIRRVLHRGE